jgi:hypothetical protein
MALVVKASESFDLMGTRLGRARREFNPARAHKIVDSSLDEAFNSRTMEQPHRPGFEGRREGGAEPKLVVAPPSAMCARLASIA